MEDEKLFDEENISNKSQLIAGLLCFFLGYLGIHRFYVGKYITGFIYLLIGLTPIIFYIFPFQYAFLIKIFSGFLVFMDLVGIWMGAFTDRKGRLLLKDSFRKMSKKAKIFFICILILFLYNLVAFFTPIPSINISGIAQHSISYVKEQLTPEPDLHKIVNEVAAKYLNSDMIIDYSVDEDLYTFNYTVQSDWNNYDMSKWCNDVRNYLINSLSEYLENPDNINVKFYLEDKLVAEYDFNKQEFIIN